MIDNTEIMALRNLPIEAVAGRLGLTVKRHYSLCPFHNDSHPSLKYYPNHNNCHCYVCGHSWGPIDLAMKVLNKDFPDACRWLANEHNVILESYKSQHPMGERPRRQYPPDTAWLTSLVARQNLIPEAARFLYQERKIDPRVVAFAGISSTDVDLPYYHGGKPFYDAPSLLIPYRDMQGQVLSVQSRYLGQADDDHPRFKFPPNSDIYIFGAPILRSLKRGDTLWIAEGVTDCLALMSSPEHRLAVAIPAARMLKDADTQLLCNLVNQLGIELAMYPDNDAPGNALYDTLSATVPVKRYQLPVGCKDFGEYWKTLPRP